MPRKDTAYLENSSSIDAITKRLDKTLTTPQVTRIALSSPSPVVADEECLDAGPSSSEYSPSLSHEENMPPAADDTSALDELWGSLRQKKEMKMSKEKCKVASLENTRSSEQGLPIDTPPPAEFPVQESEPRQKPLARQRSVTSFRESPDGRTIVASFDMRDVPRENVHVSFQRTRLVVTWVTIEVSEWVDEDGYLNKEKYEKNYQRTFPLPEGTRFEEITGAMSGRHLLLRYPNSRSFRVERGDLSR